MEDVPFPRRSTPFPNFLLDRWMPLLRDTEWRILCIVVRQTLGWRGTKPGTRRAKDWLSQSQLLRRSGRESEAVSRAISRLLQMRLIDVIDEGGNMVALPNSRKRHHGKLFYRLGSLAGKKTSERAIGD